jgi:hypothetical protein
MGKYDFKIDHFVSKTGLLFLDYKVISSGFPFVATSLLGEVIFSYDLITIKMELTTWCLSGRHAGN